MGAEPVAMIGRNGMGKTTLCKAIMGLDAPAAERLGPASTARSCSGKPPYRIAEAGLGYVPQGRRLFASLTVDEHLRRSSGARAGRGWTRERVYELFPRLGRAQAQRRGTQLSGGEQQMLAIGRALLTNPRC